MRSRKRYKEAKIGDMVRQEDRGKAKVLNPTKHGLYFDPSKFKIDYRSRLGKAIKQVMGGLLEKYPRPVPPLVQFLAMRCAYKLIRAASYEAWIMTGEEAPGLQADRDYLSLTNSLRADLQALHLLAKDGGQTDKFPQLQEYIKAKKVEVVKPDDQGPDK
jgi:hypothetical protein